MDSTDSVSSDSSEEGTPRRKKCRTATRRGLSALLDNPGVECAKKSSVYSSRVSSVLGGMKLGEGQLPTAATVGKLATPPEADSDIEEEETELFGRRPNRGSQRLASSNQGRNSKSRASSKRAKTSQKGEPYESQLIDLDSDSAGSEEENRRQLSANVLSPPSPPKEISLALSRKLRRKGALKRAVKELDRAQILNRCRDDDDDDDVSIIEVTSPPSHRQQGKPVTVKVRSRSGIQRFNIKSDDTFTNIIKAMASHEYVPADRVVMVFGDQTVEPYDTPGSLNLGIADILECHILRPGEAAQNHQTDMAEDDPDVICLKVQGKDAKSRLILRIRKNEALGKLMSRYADSQKVSLDTLRFEFDGEEISPQDTADDLELEENFCIDVITC